MRILGLDLGTNSLGWAVVDKENSEDFKLVDKGVRIFQEGVKIEKGIEGSKAAERTEYRSARRNKFRRKLRKIQVLKVLSEYGYCPKMTIEELDNWRYKKVYPVNEELKKWWKTDEETGKTPYSYRNMVVTLSLDLNLESNRFIVGRAFYHMAQRRGFLSNRLEGTKETEGAVKKEIAEISEEKGIKTLGQYFFEKYQRREKIRDTYTHREDHYLQEFNQICEFQSLPRDFTDRVRKAIFYQRPLRSQKGLVGKCVFETNKTRCSVSRLEFEEYRMLCFVNNIKVKTPEDDKLRFLNENEKEKIRPQFFRKGKEQFDFEDIVKQLAPKGQFKFYKDRNINPEDWLFNYSMRTTVSGCPVTSRFIELFGDSIYNVKFEYIRTSDNKTSFIDIDDIWHALYTFDSEQKLKEFAVNRLGFDDVQVKSFLKIHLKKDYASLSLKAIKKILPFLRAGLIYSHAVFLANMEAAIPLEVWEDKENRKIITKEIQNIIQTQNEEKQIIEIVNGIIKKCKDENASWSVEALNVFKDDLFKKIESYFGKNNYASFPNEKRNRIEHNAYSLLVMQMEKNLGRGEFAKIQKIDDRVKTFLLDNFRVNEQNLEKIYHPSAAEVYKPPIRKEDGRYYLGSPMVSAIRNPMAMRALHQLRKVINELIENDIIDASTRIHIEMARGLMNANERKAYQTWQHERETKRIEYSSKIKEHFGLDAEPSDTDILKYQLWEEQNHKCLYTGNEIGLTEFLGANPKYDVEHTIPRSLSFDNSQENKTLCENHFNRSIKRNKIPFGLIGHDQVLERIKDWKFKYEELEKQIQVATRQSRNALDKDSKDKAIQKRHRLTYEKNYWKNKYYRFTMEDVPEGFKNSQLVDTGIISKYARLYLNTLFDKVYTVKGNTVSDFRKMWGLQDEFEKKERVNHIHHCIDAVTIACITKENYENLARFYHEWEGLHIKGVDQLPPVSKPWVKFTEDIKGIEKEVLISHYTPDVLHKQSKKKLRKRGKIQYNKVGDPIFLKGDTIRGSLHKETFYGAIERVQENKKGEVEKQIKYVVRKPLDSLDDNSLKDIVDDRVREIVQNARLEEKQLNKEVEMLKKLLSKADENETVAIKQDIQNLVNRIDRLYVLPNKNGEPVPIKRVRIFQPTVTNPLNIKQQRDKSQKSPKPYKEQYHVANDSNYLMAIYEGKDEKGNVKRGFEIVNNLDAGEFFKYTVQTVLKAQNLGHVENLIPSIKVSGKLELPLKAIIKIGTMVILWEKSSEEIWELSMEEIVKRVYKVIGLSTNRVKSSMKYYEFGNTVLRHIQEARPSSALKIHDGEYKSVEVYIAQRKLSHNQLNALIEGVDFKISSLGVIRRLT